MHENQVKALRQTIEELTSLRRRLSQQLQEAQLPDVSQEIERVIQSVNGEIANAWKLFAERVNLRNDYYELHNVIDGDTVDVLAPKTLRNEGWMTTVALRLYGVDAPEKHDEGHGQYRELLDCLCSLGRARLHIVWQRERDGTKFETFPVQSHDRPIGNLFVPLPNDNVLYVNGLLATLPGISLIRKQRKPLVSLKHLKNLNLNLWSHIPHWRMWRRHDWSNDILDLGECSAKILRRLRRKYKQGRSPKHFPQWLFVWPIEVVRKDDAQLPDAVADVLLKALHKSRCATCTRVADTVVDPLRQKANAQEASAFDSTLILADAYSRIP